LQILSSEKLSSGQLPLFDAGVEAGRDVSESLASLLDRLSSRLGADAVLKISPAENAIPERACQGTPFQSSISSDGKAQNLPALLERPLRLLHTPVSISMEWPERMSWHGKRIALQNMAGPERIESGWWSESSAHRDYYIAETGSGARYWVFQRRDDARWFLHGTFE
jgi:protein ImuB